MARGLIVTREGHQAPAAVEVVRLGVMAHLDEDVHETGQGAAAPRGLLPITSQQRHLARTEVAVPQPHRRCEALLVQVAGGHHAAQKVGCRRHTGWVRAGRDRTGRLEGDGWGFGGHGSVLVIASLHDCSAMHAMRCNAAGLAGVQSCNDAMDLGGNVWDRWPNWFGRQPAGTTIYCLNTGLFAREGAPSWPCYSGNPLAPTS
jgi:hypothetical protein